METVNISKDMMSVNKLVRYANNYTDESLTSEVIQ